MNATLITWDYKEQPDFDEINLALEQTFEPRCFEVDTRSDQFAIVVANRDELEERVQAWYEKEIERRAME